MVLLWNVVLIGIVAIAVELMFGAWLDSVRASTLWQLSIYRNVDWKFSAAHLYGRQDPVVYRRDRFGLRGAYGRPSDVDILVVGGSSTDQRFITEGETWSDILRDCLTSHGQHADVANAGVAGQSSRGHIRNFEAWFNGIAGLRPKYTLVYLGVNERFLEDHTSNDDVRAYSESDLPLWLERIKLNSAIYNIYRTISGNIAAYRAGIHYLQNGSGPRSLASVEIDRRYRANEGNSVAAAAVGESPRFIELRGELRDELSAYHERLERLYATINSFGSRPIFVTDIEGSYRIADGIISGDLDRFYVMRAFADVTLEFCNQVAVACIDLDRNFHVSDGDFYDIVHSTPLGSRKIGDYVCQRLLDAPWFSLSDTKLKSVR